MEFISPQPPASPSLRQQHQALQQGLGRARQWADAGKLALEPLLQACLRDQRHDAEVEQPRGAWLWGLVEATQAHERLREPLLDQLRRLPDQRSAYQLCELGFSFAARGDQRFRDRLYAIVEQPPFADTEGLGEEQILKLDGGDGLLFAAAVRGRRLEGRDWNWGDEQLVYDAQQHLGEDHVARLLSAADERDMRRFHDRWLAACSSASRRQPVEDRVRGLQALSGDVILAETQRARPSLSLRGWGMHAGEGDLQTVLQALWTEQRPHVIVNCLRVFSNRALPSFDERLFAFCEHGDPQVRHWACNALRMNAHPRVRDFALSRLLSGRCEGVRLLSRNYARGDEERVLEALELPEDAGQRHGLLMDVIDLLEQNPQADSTRLALVAYGATPCENCRFRAVRLLHARGTAPDWLAEECRFDSSEECRLLFSSPSSRT